MKNLCIIPARGGSKRIKHKNIIDFCGKPLIARSIENALNSGIFNEVMISSDDEKIIEVALSCGASSPIKRPSELSDDFSSSSEVVKFMIKELEKRGLKYDSVCCLYATAPLISAEILKQAFESFKKSAFKNEVLTKNSNENSKQKNKNVNENLKTNLNEECEFLFAATAFDYPIQRAFGLLDDDRVSMFDESKYYARSQDLTPAYHDAGAFYFGKSRAWFEKDFMFKPYAKAFLLPRHLVCDIDTQEDLEFAKKLFMINKGK